VKKGKLKKKDVETIIEAERSGLKRRGVLEKLLNFVKNDAIFGKLLNK
ncbi:hypothetical protein LCGC14_2903380, partial [marine sediment metagenome]